MNAIDVGASLRQARTKKGLSLSQLANKTKISVSMLQALEMNDAAKLPADVFARGFLRAYAREVGIDPEQTVEMFFAQFAAATGSDEPGRGTVDAGRAGSPRDVRNEEFRTERAFPIDARLQTLVGVAVVILLVSYFAVRAWQARGSDDPTAVAEAAAASDVARAASPGPAPPAEAATPAPPAGEVLRLEYSATGPCWVSIAADAGRPVSRLMQAGERSTLEFRNGVNLRVGDAAAFAYSIEGAPGRPLGDAGMPVTVQITRDNFRAFLAR